MHNEAPDGAAHPETGRAAASDPKVALIQNSVAQLIELQREQQRTLCSFMDFLQANLLGAELAAPRQAVAASAAESAAVALESAAVARRAVVGAVPPTPILPRQVRAGGPASPRLVSVAPTPPEVFAEPAPTPAPRGESLPPRQAPAAAVADGLTPAARFKADLLRVVSERTGYPETMLDLDAHLEADLGIDSIKRIETFSALKANHNLMEGRDEEAVFEELAGLKTLNEIVAWYERLLDSKHAAGGANPPKKAQTPPSFSQIETVESKAQTEWAGAVCAYAPQPVAAPWEAGPVATGRGAGPVLVLGPDSATADAFCQALAGEGYAPWRLAPGPQTRALAEGSFTADFSAPTLVEDLRGLLRDSGRAVGGLVSLLGLDGESEPAPAGPSPAGMLFLALKVLEPDLKATAAAGGGWLLNLTALDGRFGLGGAAVFPVAGAGTLGVAKSAAREWPWLRVRCIDLDLGLGLAGWTGRVLAELRHPDPELEIGFTPAGRWRLALEPWIPHGVRTPGLEPGAVLLVTGGAHGITADIALALARKYRLRLALVGRTPLPEPEAPRTAALSDPGALRRHLIEDLQATQGKVKPAEVETRLKALLKARQIRANLEAFRETGATVEYHALDLREAEGFDRLIDDLYARWGRIDGVLHGAGVIEDRLIRDKTPDSFATVYQTKVVPAQVLARKLRPEALRFLVFFSSIAGRLGNVGQCDYSAGNEVLNKLAGRLAVAWPDVHTVAINWGPWDGGMVTEELRRLYAARNIPPIPVETGVRYCLEVLEGGAHGEPELVITAGLEQMLALGRGQSRDAAAPARAVAG